MKQLVFRKRASLSKKTPNPNTLLELYIPEEFRVYQPSLDQTEKFLSAETGPMLQRILIFGRESWLAHLSAEEWFIDGRFKISPCLFNQVLVIIVKRFQIIFPVIYALLPDKKLSTYKDLF